MKIFGVHQFYLMHKKALRLNGKRITVLQRRQRNCLSPKTEKCCIMLQTNCNTKRGIAFLQAYFNPDIKESIPIIISRIRVNFLK